MNKRVLVTGASGFIGSFLVDEALGHGYEVIAAVRPNSSREFLTDARIQFISLDYESPDRLKAQLAGANVDYVVHCAGTTGTKGSGDFEKVNFEYTRNLVDALNEPGFVVRKVLYMSTLAVQGPGADTFQPLRVDMKEQPITRYAKSKLKAERYLEEKARFPYVIVRPTAVYGPRDKDFLAYFRWIQRGLEPHIGRHQQMLSMIYVKDLASASVSLLEHAHPSKCYIASDGQSYPETDLGRYIRAILHKRPLSLRIPLTVLRPLISLSDAAHGLLGKHPFLSREKLDEVSAANWLCDSRPLWTELGREPAYLLEAGLKETADWYRKQGWL